MTKTKTSIWSNHRNSTERVKSFVDEFIRSEFMQSWTESAINSDYSIGGRFGRCMDAAENGADGSTHAEVIDDWRDAFSYWLHDQIHGGCDGINRGDRLNAAVRAYFDSVEAWHDKNGSLEQEIG